MSASSLNGGAGSERQLGTFVASDGLRFRVSHVSDRILVSYEQQPSGRTGVALELTVEDGAVIGSCWYSIWVGASAEAHGAVLDPTMELLVEQKVLDGATDQ